MSDTLLKFSSDEEDWEMVDQKPDASVEASSSPFARSMEMINASDVISQPTLEESAIMDAALGLPVSYKFVVVIVPS